MKRGFSNEAADVMLSSIQESTSKQYETAIHLWWNYCVKAEFSPFDINVTNIAQFFSDPKLKDKSYSTLNIYRSALSLLSLNDLGKDPGLARFFKGLSVQKPQKPKYESIWDPDPVIKFLATQNPNDSIPLQNLTKKLVTLLALITAQRVQTLSKISIDNIVILDKAIQIKIVDRIKTSGRNKNQPLLHIPKFDDQPAICVAATLTSYLKRTKSIRQENKKLFITFKKPYHEASSQTISRWIKDTLHESGINTDVFTAHSTRHASTSAAARGGVNIETIRKTAGWSEKSTVFARFYNRPLAKSADFVSAVIRSTEMADE